MFLAVYVMKSFYLISLDHNYNLIKMEAELPQDNRRDIKALICQINPIYKEKVKTIERVQISL